jgi:predicted Zn-dependent peptidase
MHRITNEIRMAFITDLKSLEGLSDRLAWFERLRSWKDIFTYPDRITGVKPEEIPAAVKQYLDPGRMTIGLLLQHVSDSAAGNPRKAVSPKH